LVSLSEEGARNVIFKIPAFPQSGGRLTAVLLLLVGVPSASRAQVKPDIPLGSANCGPATQPQKPQIVYSAKPGETVKTEIPVRDASGNPLPAGQNVVWELSSSAATGCPFTSAQLIHCGPDAMAMNPVFTVQAPPGTPSGANSAGWVQITSGLLTNEHIGRQGIFGATVAEADGDPSCNWNYLLRVVNNGGGWGDPHLTTVNGVHYDFQSAGEFTALREKDLELQTRQTAVPTTSLPSANPYTGLATCVAIYTAVAVRIGSTRVTLQPNISGRPDPSGLQVRVNGRLITLTSQGIDLVSNGERSPVPRGQPEGRVVRGAGGAIEIIDWRGTQIVVTPAWWPSQQKWYLDVNVYQTSAILGTMGVMPRGSWLPALPDGTPFGTQPGSLTQRYQELYEKFADAWRVTTTTSLFDYAPGTTTATFTLDEWPRFTPQSQSCALAGQPSASPVTPQVAAQACAGIADPNQKADCIFDVTYTGNRGFAEGYKRRTAVKPRGTGWQPALKPQPRRPPAVPRG
jgi:hypothetical protein